MYIKDDLNVFRLIFLLKLTSEQIFAGKRQRRYLLFTPNTQWGVFATVAIPLHPETTVSVSWFFEANYYNVANATYFDPLLDDATISSREERDLKESEKVITRSRIYGVIESMLEKHGYPGRACLLRAICENARTHLPHNGVLGDLLQFILTPSTSISEEDVDDCYYEAEYYGMEDSCDYHKDCCTNPLDFITTTIDIP
ncbi:hypothetical protein K1T71_009148 [Dendrolimus kikuchii]|uniref:Uncharacterized protein n=1 Tax=Dendrolimus kikuchii TaxID=765133 RepID=A0ACC1CTS0_9NEOP|nr:hypothetical protein K1T71_009148 [Dendrolimus kikuchii]